MRSNPPPDPTGRIFAMSAKTTKRVFSRATEVSIDIDASAAVVWALLTNAPGYPAWNSTVVSIERVGQNSDWRSPAIF
jgi:Polyketide cyclase / dehydrase and lipid transport